ncbi:ATP-binding protein [Metamycoplasma alkalescens]|uniref:AAA ATPase-domain-containing protein n=1 Tax=Metamycoplasma alkalescens TaxID=45363 RepID=A0A318U5Y7_9BACT|nr:ATP-binding protein [Metamycoplasma alkalescens]PYF42610.1 ATPase family protein associated with various cellular activities (AAA) [Metamycoplasma alkalescens]SYV90352.1 AAA ATPase-domain-containing protein [Metamycoplasma alkalescens]
MKKGNVINLIRYYVDNNDIAFRNEAYLIAKEFYNMGDEELSLYILSLLSDVNSFVPQENNGENITFAKKINLKGDPLPLPSVIENDIKGIINSCFNQSGINKFLFIGSPGTGKTESAKNIARILKRELFLVDFNNLIDSKLGQTQKNIAELFKQINELRFPEKAVILFDEIDAIALNRIDSSDVREMGRVTTSILNGLDNLSDKILLIATTNLYQHFDKALSRRFDSIIDFNRYQKDELIQIAELILNFFLSKYKYKNIGKNIRLFRKIISSMQNIPFPGELKNMIKTCLAFSDPNDEFDYLKRLFSYVSKNNDLKTMKEYGFSIRETELLTGVSKSKISRDLKGLLDESK